jgi:competence protein ComGC
MDTTSPNHPRFVRWAVVLGIVIVLNVFFAVLISLILPEPKMDNFCPAEQVVQSYDTQASCTAVGGQWTANSASAKDSQTTLTTPQSAGYCDAQYTCRMAYTSAQESHSRDAFIAFVVLGVIALIIGVLPLGSSIVSSGLSFGGVVTLIIGSAEYWGTADNWIRLAISLVALLALLYIGWRRFRD